MIVRRNYFDHINGNVLTGASGTHGVITCTSLVEKPEWKRSLRRCRHKWQHNIKLFLNTEVVRFYAWSVWLSLKQREVKNTDIHIYACTNVHFQLRIIRHIVQEVRSSSKVWWKSQFGYRLQYWISCCNGLWHGSQFLKKISIDLLIPGHQ
jgi:hypothetical protein